MKLPKDKVRHVAKLANLPLTDFEEVKYSEQLSKILDYIDQLNQVDTLQLRSGQASIVEPIYNVSGQKNVMAKDEVTESISQEGATKNASNKKQGFIVTKGVFSDE